MAARRRSDSLESTIEAALRPGWFISCREGTGFAAGLEEAASGIEKLIAADPESERHRAPRRPVPHHTWREALVSSQETIYRCSPDWAPIQTAYAVQPSGHRPEM